MVATIYKIDQNRHLRHTCNFLNTEEVVRYDLMQSSDQVLDGVIFVSPNPLL